MLVTSPPLEGTKLRQDQLGLLISSGMATLVMPCSGIINILIYSSLTSSVLASFPGMSFFKPALYLKLYISVCRRCAIITIITFGTLFIKNLEIFIH